MHQAPGASGAPILGHGFERGTCGLGFLAELSGSASTRVLPLALTALARMGDRGTMDGEGGTGDGAGVTTQIPHDVLQADLDALGFSQVPPRDLAVGCVFVPRADDAAAVARALVGAALEAEGLSRIAWRAVPIRAEVLGGKATRSRPGIAQVVAARPGGATDEEFEHRLYRARREATARALDRGLAPFAIVSLSHRSLVYKALVRAAFLADFYPDLRHPAFTTAFTLFHQQVGSDANPSWALTQPFRLLAHDGEVHTMPGNRVWMEAREPSPLLRAARSDSANLDEVLGLLTHRGRDVLHAVSLLLPPAWESDGELPPAVRDFFEYQSCVMEPWDGPALVVFTDGRVVGAALDRNGVRPAWTTVTTDGLVLVASDGGVLDVPEDRVIARDRLGPGGVVAVDLRARRFLDGEAIHGRLAARRPYGAWLRAHRILGVPLGVNTPEAGADAEAPVPDLRARRALRDTLFSYFEPRFPPGSRSPIDPLREALVSLATHLGPRGDFLRESPEHAAQVHLDAPVLSEHELRALAAWRRGGWTARTLSLLFPAEGGADAFRTALHRLLADAEAAVRDGATLLVLSDRGLDDERAPLPSLLAVSAVHHHLLRRGLRLRASLVVESGGVRDGGDVAALVGFGAEAVCPYLALARDQEAAGARGDLPTLNQGIRKILSRMGLSTLRSYHGAQLFEAVGIAEDLVATHFPGTPSRAGGLGLDDLAREVLEGHGRAYAPRSSADVMPAEISGGRPPEASPARVAVP